MFNTKCVLAENELVQTRFDEYHTRILIFVSLEFYFELKRGYLSKTHERFVLHEDYGTVCVD